MPAMDIQTLAWIISERVANANHANIGDSGGLRYTLTYAAFRPCSDEQRGDAVYQLRVDGYGDTARVFPTGWRTYHGIDAENHAEDDNETSALKTFASAAQWLSGTRDMFERVPSKPLTS